MAANNSPTLPSFEGQTSPDFEDFFENGAIGLHIVGGDGIILRANKAELAMMGYTAEEYMGRNITEFHADAPVIQDILTRLTGGEKLDRYPARLRTKSGDIRDVIITSSALFESGKFLNTRCFTIDVTETIKAQKLLEAERKRAEDQQTLLIRELHHRVRNTLATVTAIMGTTMRFSAGMEEFKEAFTGRIVALSKTHSLLTDETSQSISLRSLLRSELEPFDDATGRIALDGADVLLTAEIAVPLGMIIHELTTNAVKHGALSAFGGTLSVAWREQGGRMTLSWNEANVPILEAPTRTGFGQQLLTRVLPQQLHGVLHTEYAADGLRLCLDFPLSQAAARDSYAR
jgi:PAS domain S-box-containing protein